MTGTRFAQFFSYDAATRTATILLSGLTSDNYTLTLLSSATGFRDAVGNPLDGERHPTLTVPSGDGAIGGGGDFVLYFRKRLAITIF